MSDLSAIDGLSVNLDILRYNYALPKTSSVNVTQNNKVFEVDGSLMIVNIHDYNIAGNVTFTLSNPLIKALYVVSSIHETINATSITVNTFSYTRDMINGTITVTTNVSTGTSHRYIFMLM